MLTVRPFFHLLLLVIHPGQQAVSDLSAEADRQGSGP